MSVNNPNFPQPDRRVEEGQKELIRIPKTSHIASNAGTIHASTFQVTKTLGRQIAPAPGGTTLGSKTLTPQQFSSLTSTIHKKEIQKPISLTTSTPATTSMSNIIPVQISGTSSAASITHAGAALHVQNVSSIVRAAAVPGGASHPPAAFTHLPRGVVAAQAVRAGSTVSIQRQSLPTSLQMPSHTLPHSLQSQIRNVLPQSIKPGTQPANRSMSPVISIGNAQSADPHRASISLHNATTVSNTPSIQITLQASRTSSEGIKPVTTYQAGKVHMNTALNMTTQSKVVMTHSLTPVLQHPTLAAKGNRGQPMVTTPLSTVTMAISTATVTIPILSSGTTSTSIPIGQPMVTTPLSTVTMAISTATVTIPILSSGTTSTSIPIGQPMVTTPLSTVTMAISTATVTIPILSSGTTSTSIPIAKVTPQRQLHTGPLPHSIPTSHPAEPRSEPSTFTQPQPAHSHNQPSTQGTVPPSPAQTQSQSATSLFIPKAPRGSPIVTTVVSTSSTETRDSLPTMPFFPPYMLSPDNPYYQQLMRYQVAAVAQQQARPNLITPQSTASLAASLQASHTGSQASVTRLSHPLMLMQDSLRHTTPQTTVASHGPFHNASSEGQTKVSVASTEHATPLTVPAPTQVSGISVAAVYPSSTYSTHVSQVLHQASHQGLTGLPSSTPVNNPSSSPRPSILRKRTNDGISTVKKQLALTSVPEVHSPRPEPRPDSTPQSNMSSPKTPASGESQSSTDTALSSEATTPTQNHDKIKHEPPEHQENGYTNNTPEVSPRKRRKQLLQATEEIRDTPLNVFDKLVEACVKEDEEEEYLYDDDDLDDTLTDDEKMDIKEEYIDDEGIRWTVEKCRSGVTLLNFYNISWKPKNNHFNRYSDVKPKDERRPSVNELSNQKGVVQKASGWKLYHMAAQIEDLVALEKDLNDKLADLQTLIAPGPPPRHSILEDESVMLHELTQGNIQRCKLITDQLEEAKSSMLKVLEHKPKISEIITKHMSKRPIKKKERT